MLAARALSAFVRGERTEQAELGALLIAEFLESVRALTGSFTG